MKLDVRLDDRAVKEAIDALGKRFPYAVKRAFKRTATAVKTVMAKEIAADTGLPSKRIKDEIRVGELGASGIRIEVRGKRLPLIDFRARGPEPSRGRGSGVSYKLPGGRGRAPKAFIATMQSGHRGVFQRYGKKVHTKRRPRGVGEQAIEQLHGPSLVRVFEKFLPLGAKRGEEALRTNLAAEVNFALSKKR